MRSVLQLSADRKAVVEIPYSKLPEANHDQSCCESKFVISGAGNKSRPNAQLKRMVEELEEAYDKDLKELQSKINQAQVEKASMAATHSKEMARMTNDFSSRAASYDKQLDALRAACEQKESQLRKANQEKEVILRNKISQFKQFQYISRINEQEQIIRLKDVEIKELLSRLELSQLDRARAEEQAHSNRFKLETEISKLSLELSETTKKYVSEQSNLSFASKIKEEDAHKLIQELKYSLQLAERALKESEFSNQSKARQISALTETSSRLQGKVTELLAQTATFKEGKARLQEEKDQLLERLSRSNEAVAFLDSEKGRLLLQMADRLAEIDKLRVQLASKEKVYEVKIERVIDGKEQIDQLQAAVFELEQQMKLLSQDKDYLAEDLKKKQRQVDELAAAKLKLEAEIAGLKGYISKREGSFRWTVERQIEKDMLVSDQRPQSYKVSQVGQYLRDAGDPNRVISQQIAMNIQANLFGAYPEQLNLQSSQN